MKKLLRFAGLFLVLLLFAFPVLASAQNSLHDIPGEHVIVATVPATAAGTDKLYGIAIVPFKSVVVDCKLVYESTITGSTTNSVTATLLNGGSGGTGTTIVASKAYTNGVDAAALVPEALTNSSTAANLNLSADDVLVYKSDQVASGVIDPIHAVIVTIKGR